MVVLSPENKSSEMLEQGEILVGLQELQPVLSPDAGSAARFMSVWTEHPRAMVITPGCDLENDFSSPTCRNTAR